MTRPANKNKLVLKCCFSKLYLGKHCICPNIIEKQDLPEVCYNGQPINYNSVNCFTNVCNRNQNDSSNKIRENVIGAIINRKIPEIYYKLCANWNNLHIQIQKYLNQLANTINQKIKAKLTHKGGRKEHSDFGITINDVDYKVEFKFNACNKKDIPQFVSPSKPSVFFETSYEKYYYDNYLPQLAEFSGMDIPNEEQYLKEINSNRPSCMIQYQDMYYNGCKNSSKYTSNQNDIDFYNKANELDNASRISFIKNNSLNIVALSSYLCKTQPNKIYMLFDYKTFSFHLDKSDPNDYMLTSYTKEPNKYRYIVQNKNEKRCSILLRWKNGNGIAFPALQIKHYK